MKARILSLVLVSFLVGWSQCPLARSPDAPGAPLGFQARATSSTTVELSWYEDHHVETYELLADSQPVESNLHGEVILDGTMTSFVNTGLAPGTSYTYELFGHNEAGDGPVSTASATTFPSDAGTPPPDPTGFAAAATGDTAIHLRWDTPLVNATGLLLEREDAGTFDLIARPAVTSSSYEDTGLFPSTVYTYRLRATNDAGPSPGVLTSATTLAASGGTGSVQLSWDLAGVDPRADGGHPCALWGVDHVGAQIAGQSGTAACSAGTLRIDGVPPGISPLTATLYFGGGDGGSVSDTRSVNVSITAGQLTQANVDFQPI